MHPEQASHTRNKRMRARRWTAIGGVALAAVLVSGVIVALAALREDPQPLGFEPSPTAVAEAPPPTSSQEPSPEPTHTPTPVSTATAAPPVAPTPEPTLPTPSVTPDVAHLPLPAYEHNSILRVEVDRLAVRRSPLLTSRLATAWEWRGDEWIELGDARLNVGDYVSVDLGPLVIGDTVWYRVWEAEDAILHYSTRSWDTRDDGANPVEPGWVAASVAGSAYLSLHQEADDWSAGIVASAGSGAYLSESTETHDLFGLDWALAGNESGSDCIFRLSLETLDGSASFLALETSLAGPFDEGAEILGTGNRMPIVGDWGDFVRVRVVSDCRWTFVLHAWGHD